jgi:hypothetical protein
MRGLDRRKDFQTQPAIQPRSQGLGRCLEPAYLESRW